MSALKLLLALALLCLSSLCPAQQVTYDSATGLVVIPSVKVQADTYVNVALQLTTASPTLTFQLTGATLGTPGAAALGTYDPTTSVLTLPAVKVGDTGYRATLEHVGNNVFVLRTADVLPPTVTLSPPAPGAVRLSGHAYNVDRARTKVVLYVLTNQWYVQPFDFAPFTSIAADGSWINTTHPWDRIAVLLVDPSTYTPAATRITHPALDPGVVAWAVYPTNEPPAIEFSGRRWGVKATGNAAGNQFDPGPNYWSNDPSVVSVDTDGLHLKIRNIGGHWQAGEVYLLGSLGYGTYTVRVASRLDQLDLNTVAAPLFLYAAPGQELDYEYSGSGGLIPGPNNAQFVVQPYTTPGNLVRYAQPATAQTTAQMEWRSDRVVFRAWKGWSNAPAASDMIHEWTYRGENIPKPGPERVRINLWLLNGHAPTNGIGDEMVINAFDFAP